MQLAGGGAVAATAPTAGMLAHGHCRLFCP